MRDPVWSELLWFMDYTADERDRDEADLVAECLSGRILAPDAATFANWQQAERAASGQRD